jgi:hypothetical protein
MAVTGAQIIAEVKKFVGDPYVWGAAGPSSFDCSGLVQYALTQLGFKGVPRTSEAQWSWVQKITQSQLQPGDLIFEQWPGDTAPPGHVVIYAGNGQVLEAPQTGQTVHERAWSPTETTIIGYGRPPGMSAAPGSSTSPSGSGLLSLFLPDSVTQVFSTAEEFIKGIMWVLNPENWMRMISGAAGVLLAGAGILFLIKAGA